MSPVFMLTLQLLSLSKPMGLRGHLEYREAVQVDFLGSGRCRSRHKGDELVGQHLVDLGPG